MDKNCFCKLMEHPEALTPDEWDELRKERDSYPFCAPLQVLSLLADKLGGAPLWERQGLPRVALYMNEADRLYEQLEAISSPTFKPAPEAELRRSYSEAKAQPEPPADEEPATSTAEADDFDVLQEINAYQEVSFKTAPKDVILTNFLEKDGGIDLSDNDFETVPVQELAKKSVSSENSLESETLALILEKQGKIAQAIDMYAKLIVKNPEKSSIFAVRISALKTQLYNEK